MCCWCVCGGGGRQGQVSARGCSVLLGWIHGGDPPGQAEGSWEVLGLEPAGIWRIWVLKAVVGREVVSSFGYLLCRWQPVEVLGGFVPSTQPVGLTQDSWGLPGPPPPLCPALSRLWSQTVVPHPPGLAHGWAGCFEIRGKAAGEANVAVCLWPSLWPAALPFALCTGVGTGLSRRGRSPRGSWGSFVTNQSICGRRMIVTLQGETFHAVLASK